MATGTNTSAPIIYGDLVTDTATTPKYALWTKRVEDGKAYRYVQFDNGAGNVASVDGKLAYFQTTGYTSGVPDVTMDVSDTDRNHVCGVFVSVIADASYGWIQTGGQDTVTTNGDDDVALGDAIIASAAGDGTADSTAQDTAPTNKVVGWALADDVNGSDTVLVWLTLDTV